MPVLGSSFGQPSIQYRPLVPWSHSLGRTPPNFHGCLPAMQASYDSAGIEPYLRLDFFHARRRLAEAAANPFCAIFATFPNLVDQVRDLGSPKLIITHIFS